MKSFGCVLLAAAQVYSQSDQFGAYSVAFEEVKIGELQQGSQMALAAYPANATAGQQFPLVSFSHGDYGGGVDLLSYKALLQEMASWGLVVLAHRSCGPLEPTGGCGDTQYLDQLRVLDWARELRSQNLDDAKAMAVHDRINISTGFGVSGHSTGGRSTFQSAMLASQYDIRAAVAIHPDPKVDSASNITYCPMAVFTGTADQIEPKGSALDDFNACPKPKIFADLQGAGKPPLYKRARTGVSRLLLFFTLH
jgi:hypothetical protein